MKLTEIVIFLFEVVHSVLWFILPLDLTQLTFCFVFLVTANYDGESRHPAVKFRVLALPNFSVRTSCVKWLILPHLPLWWENRVDFWYAKIQETHALSPHPQVRAGKQWHFPTLGSSDWHHLSGSEPGATASQEECSECFICTSHYICPFSGHNTTQSYGTALSEPLPGLTAVYFCSENLRVWDQARVHCFDPSQYNMYILVLYSYFNKTTKTE